MLHQRWRVTVLTGLLAALGPTVVAGQGDQETRELVERYVRRGMSGTPLHVFFEPCDASNQALGVFLNAALGDDFPPARLGEVTAYVSGMRLEQCPDPRLDDFLRELVRRTPPIHP